MQDAQSRWGHTVPWIMIIWGIASLLLTLAGVFLRSPEGFALPFYFMFYGVAHLVYTTRPRLADVCMVVAGVAAVAATVFVIALGITR